MTSQLKASMQYGAGHLVAADFPPDI